jgi:hypothetical protein
VIRFFASSTPYHLSVSHKPATISPTPCSFYRQNAVLHSINPQVKKESHHVRSPSTSAAGDMSKFMGQIEGSMVFGPVPWT